MDPASEQQKSFGQKLQEKIAQSRFFTFSLLLHVVIIVLGGTVVLFHRAIDAPDFTSIGDGLMSAEPSVTPPAEMPPDMSQEQTFTPEAPSITAPSVSAITTNTTNNTAFSMASIPMPVKAITGDTKNLVNTNKALSSKMGKGVPGSMGGRMGGQARNMARMANKGTDKGEKAVLQALKWLKEHQKEDGSWSDEHKPGMSGLALLCFLGHGELPESPEFGETVKKALDWMLAKGTASQGKMTADGGFGGQPAVYEHAIMTYAMGEYYSMTKDDRFAELLKQAVGYIVAGQNPLGGWDYRYAKSQRNDLSVAGWQIQALKAAHLTGLGIPGVDEALDKSMDFIKKWQGNEGGFGYTGPENRLSLTGVGVLCTYFWKESKDRTVKEGIDFLLGKVTEVKYKGGKTPADLYGWYYDTQACLMFGGSAWSKWNKMFQEEIVDNQSPDGSWPPTGGAHLQPKPDGAGPYYRTTLCCLMLEVFYRYMPINK